MVEYKSESSFGKSLSNEIELVHILPMDLAIPLLICLNDTTVYMDLKK